MRMIMEYENRSVGQVQVTALNAIALTIYANNDDDNRSDDTYEHICDISAEPHDQLIDRSKKVEERSVGRLCI